MTEVKWDKNRLTNTTYKWPELHRCF